MADDTNNLNNSAFGEDVSEKKLAFREKQKKARLSGKSYMTLNKHTRKEIAAKPLSAVEESRLASSQFPDCRHDTAPPLDNS
ncbi:hypothetical protein J6590_083712 [Homalodisca vitripennis]|nr:hypothetical protein J6590_083712 [Homalodisca vitripennis]